MKHGFLEILITELVIGMILEPLFSSMYRKLYLAMNEYFSLHKDYFYCQIKLTVL